MADQTARSESRSDVGRRQFLRLGAAATVSAAVLTPTDLLAGFPRPTRHLSFNNINTGERFSGEYWSNGRYFPDALREINRFMRDWRTGDVHWIDPKLLDLVFALQSRLGIRGPFQVVCGYRAPRTNRIRYAMRSGVAKNSFHMKGQAIDIRLPGVSLSELHAQAVSLRAGGVGYYPHSDFIHVDVGPVRYWGAGRYQVRPSNRGLARQPLDLPGEDTDSEALFDVEAVQEDVQPISRSVSRHGSSDRGAARGEPGRALSRRVARKPRHDLTLADKSGSSSGMQKVAHKPGAQIASQTGPVGGEPTLEALKQRLATQKASLEFPAPDLLPPDLAATDDLLDAWVRQIPRKPGNPSFDVAERVFDAVARPAGAKPSAPGLGDLVKAHLRLPGRKPIG